MNSMQAAHPELERTAGEIYNVGGWMKRAMSVVEMLDAIEVQTGSCAKAAAQAYAARQSIAFHLGCCTPLTAYGLEGAHLLPADA